MRSREVEVPGPMIGLSERRTEFLFRHMQYSSSPMKTIRASAYLQGMNDMFDALENARMIRAMPKRTSAARSSPS